jgi:hypothetical protein
MEFLYPLFNQPTHTVNVDNCSNTEELPIKVSDKSKRQYLIPKDAVVSIVEESVGLQLNWHRVKIIDPTLEAAEYYNLIVYIPKNQLQKTTSKQEYSPNLNSFNLPSPSAAEVNPLLQEMFIPYVDQKNGLFSVRIQTDYDRLIDQVLFYNVLEEVLVEGASILLATRGFASDNTTIDNLRSTFTTFAYINKDLDITTTRSCEPLTFTVSIPMRFFNSFEPAAEEELQDSGQIARAISLTNKNFVNRINSLLSTLTKFTGDLDQLLSPNKFIDGFILDAEILFIKQFSDAFAELVGLSGYPVDDVSVITYSLELSENYDLLGVTFKKENREFKASRSLLAQFKLQGKFNNKRIFYYLFNLDNMISDSLSLEALPFITKYAQFPSISLKTFTVKIGDTKIPDEKVQDYYAEYIGKSESCITLGDIKGAASSTLAFTDAYYSLFIEQQFGTQTIKPSWARFAGDIKEIRKEFEKAKAGGNPSPYAFDKKEFWTDFSSNLKESVVGAFEENEEFSYRRTANALSYAVHRINLNKILFEAVFCNTRNANLANIVSQIPDQIIFYFENLRELSQLRGTAFAKAVVNGFNINGNVYCSTSEAQSIAYFIKGVTILMNTARTLNALGGIFTRTSEQLERVANKEIENPYRVIAQSISRTLLKASVDATLDILSDVLSDSCEEDIFLSNGNNYQNPFNSHYPTSRFQGQQSYDNDKINNNRAEVLEELYQFGYDREEAVDYLKEAIDYINCILTAQESIQLLSGEPTDIVKALVKSIIKNRFKQLAFLVEDEQKMVLFFKRLGLTVDPEIITNIQENISYEPVESSICKPTPEQEKARGDLLGDKLPDIGVLQDAVGRKEKRSRKLIDFVKNGNQIELDFSPLCPDNPTAESAEFKQHIAEQYSKNLDSLFSSPISSFTQQASSLGTAFHETGKFYRTDEDGDIFGEVEYKTINRDYGYNLLRNQILSDAGFTAQPPVIENIDGSLVVVEREPISYQPEDSEKDKYSYTIDYNKLQSRSTPQKISDAIFKTPTSLSSLVVCKDSNLQVDDFIKNFIGSQVSVENDTSFEMASTGFLVEEALLDELLNEDEINGVSPVSQKYIWALSRKKFIATLTFNYDFGSDTEQFLAVAVPIVGTAIAALIAAYQKMFNKDPIFNIESVTFRLFYKEAGKFKEVELVEIQDQDIKEELYEKNFFAAFEDDFKVIDDNYSSDVLKVGYETIVKSSQKVKAVFNDVFLNKFKPKIELIEKWENIQQISNLYGEAIFKIHTTFDDVTKKITRTILTPTISGLVYGATPQVKYNNFLTIEKENYTNKNFLYPEEDPQASQGRILRMIDVATSLSPYVNIMPDYEKFKPSNIVQNWFENLAGLPGDYFEGSVDPLNDKDAEGVFYDTTENEGYFTNYIKLNYFNIARTEQHVVCDLYPHYLNYQYFKKKALNTLVEELCDDNFESQYRKMVREISVNMFFRTVVTTILLKSLPYLSSLTQQEFNQIYKDKFVIDTINQFIIKQLIIFSNTYISNKYNQEDESLNPYRIILQNATKLYEEYRDSRKLVNKYRSQERDISKQTIEYFIGREIDYFIRFSNQNSIIKHADYDIGTLAEVLRVNYGVPQSNARAGFFSGERLKILQDEINKNCFMNTKYSYINEIKQRLQSIGGDQLADDAKTFIRNERDTLFLYSVMSCEVDINKKFIFSQTISELFSIITNNSLESEIKVAQSTIDDINRETNQEELEKFIGNLGSSNVPAALFATKPQYARYIAFAVKAIFDTSRDVLLRTAQVSDRNIIITRGINDGLALASIASWSLIDPQARQKILYSSRGAYTFLKRIDDGKSPFPDLLTSLGVIAASTGAITPQPLGIGYLALDSISETVYTIEKLKEYEALNPPADPCELKDKEEIKTVQPCTLETKQGLIARMDAQEQE